tara:strand:- start:164 stop:820 length:657 start_codon:yes stop_codon:yes gene_type:complete
MTTFTAQTLLYALKTLDNTGGASLSADSLGFSLSQGQFMEFLYLLDSPQTTDAQVLAFFKTLTDSSTAAENATLAFTKALADTPATTDETLFAVAKALSDAPRATDLMARSFSRPGVTDAATVSDTASNHLNSHAFDTVTATDDVDGAASIQDDQEVQFFKTRTDVASVTDVFVRFLTIIRALSDTASVTDTGLLRSQGYTTDFSYFLEDYVGVSRTL